MGSKAQPYAENGVMISKSPIKVGDDVALTYNGLLVLNGAVEVYAHIGYGEDWKEKTFIPMVQEDGLFKATFKISIPETLNVCFKDSGDHWDNNSNSNYSFAVSKAAKAAKAAAEKKTTEIKTAKLDETAAEKIAEAPVKAPAPKKTSAKAAKPEDNKEEKKPAAKASKTAEAKKTSEKAKPAAKKKST